MILGAALMGLLPHFSRSSLLLVTLRAVASGFEGPRAVVTGAAVLTGVDVGHLEILFLHHEYLGVALAALHPLACVVVSLEGHLAHGGLPFHGFSCGNRHRLGSPQYHDQCYQLSN